MMYCRSWISSSIAMLLTLTQYLKMHLTENISFKPLSTIPNLTTLGEEYTQPLSESLSYVRTSHKTQMLNSISNPKTNRKLTQEPKKSSKKRLNQLWMKTRGLINGITSIIIGAILSLSQKHSANREVLRFSSTLWSKAAV